MTRCEIDLDRFDYNIERVKELAKESRVMAVIKADAYGHGAAVLMRRLFSHGIDVYKRQVFCKTAYNYLFFPAAAINCPRILIYLFLL